MNIREILYVAVNGGSSRRLKITGKRTMGSGQILKCPLPTVASSHGLPQRSRPRRDLEGHSLAAILSIHLSCMRPSVGHAAGRNALRPETYALNLFPLDLVLGPVPLLTAPTRAAVSTVPAW